MDDISFIRSMHTDIPEHAGAMMMMNVGALSASETKLLAKRQAFREQL